MRNCQPGAYYAGAGRRVAEADLRHISVSDHPTTDIRETCTYIPEALNHKPHLPSITDIHMIHLLIRR